MLTISCPGGPVNPGGFIEVTGTSSNCNDTEAVVTMDGDELDHVWSCKDGVFKITMTAPQCGSGSNVIIFRVKLGNEDDSCVVAVDCP